MLKPINVEIKEITVEEVPARQSLKERRQQKKMNDFIDGVTATNNEFAKYISNFETGQLLEKGDLKNFKVLEKHLKQLNQVFKGFKQ